MAIEFNDQPNKVIIDEQSANRITVEEQNTHVEIAIGGPQGARGPQGIQGPQGPPGIDTGYYAYTQTAPATTWNITHNLGINPSVTAVDSAGNVIEGTLLYLTTNTLEITFGIATSGHAYMS